ncbi:MAG: signal recognition particle-docking protein FtsY, partial [Sulfuricurvum sp. 24-42-5]
MFSFIKKGLQKTVDAISAIVPEKKLKISKDELENILLESDVEYDLVEIIMRELYQDEITREQLRSKLLATLSYAQNSLPDNPDKPTVTLIIGVNGAGKTTTIAKLAQHHLNNGERVILGAADTFRAA